jgi:nitroimidazol reductase NimA-like FMN-containing flavoprotein (pyridoxamine 5'-phosphate oxidase superfamily)
LEGLLAHQRVAVLATQRGEAPYGSLVAFARAAGEDSVLFATTRSTRKYENLTDNDRVALVVDDRANTTADFHAAAAVTVLGAARELQGEERAAWAQVYLQRHPYLVDFLNSPSCALFLVTVDKYLLVRSFQQVTEILPPT